MAGFIIGFDGEATGAGQRIVDFIEQAAIPDTTFSMLQALPDTALWHRLEKEGRLISKEGDINQTTLMNFVPTRPIEEIVDEYLDAIDQLFDPKRYLERVYTQFMRTKPLPSHLFKATVSRTEQHPNYEPPLWMKIRAALIIIWNQGVWRKSHRKFWKYLHSIMQNCPERVLSYILHCSHMEYFIHYYPQVRKELIQQLEDYLRNHPGKSSTADLTNFEVQTET